MKLNVTRILSFCTCICLATVLFAQDNSATKQESDTKTAEKKSDDKPEPIKFTVADGQLSLECSGTWKKVQKKSNMLDAELKVPRSEGDTADGRLTIMGAGGSVEANITRWQGQFAGKSEMKRTEMKVDGQKVHMVDIKGTYMEGMGGPFGPKTEREGYCMLAAIVETKGNGLYFFKLTGPQKTLKANKAHFESLVKSMQVVD